MNKTELIDAICTTLKFDHQRDASKAEVAAMLDSFTHVTAKALANGDEITLNGIGKLKVVTKAARTGRNPQTGETIQIAEKRVAKFVPAKALKDSL